MKHNIVCHFSRCADVHRLDDPHNFTIRRLPVTAKGLVRANGRIDSAWGSSGRSPEVGMLRALQCFEAPQGLPRCIALCQLLRIHSP